MKDKYYFSHDYEASNDPKVLAMVSEFGAAGYGFYWRIIEMLHAEDSHKLPLKPYLFLAIAKQMLTDAKQIEAFVKQSVEVFELFETDGVFFWSNRVLRNIERRDEIREKRREAGQKGANAKQMLANAEQNQAIVKQTESNAQQNLAKESKGKEIESKVNNITPPNPLEGETGEEQNDFVFQEQAEEQTVIDTLEDEEKEKDPPVPPPPPELPFGEAFAVAWQLWIDYRKERKLAAYKPIGLKMALKDLVTMAENSEQQAIEIINHTISKNWQGLQKPNNHGTASKKSPHPVAFSTAKDKQYGTLGTGKSVVTDSPF